MPPPSGQARNGVSSSAAPEPALGNGTASVWDRTRSGVAILRTRCLGPRAVIFPWRPTGCTGQPLAGTETNSLPQSEGDPLKQLLRFQLLAPARPGRNQLAEALEEMCTLMLCR
ncbi:nuclear factor interleukin-3-regulated protein-like [Platysternon megacephalum]|uniref:Nuclear factor interleukin-3-regulated protein-like n=1 Tax=Platysternon megacephalum TaxID=55544 RepID=A0A4D9DVY9_9SAUR|nr:nuclear factor interleukin-3-regulated protein-like [Platysternon megacephalum]